MIARTGRKRDLDTLMNEGRESVPRRAGRLMSVITGVGVAAAMAVAGLVGASRATAEQADVSIALPNDGTLGERGTPAAVPFPATVRPSQRVTISAGEEGVVPERVDQGSSAQSAGPPERTDIILRRGQDDVEEYDPWEPYNEAMFSFNHDVFDRYL